MTTNIDFKENDLGWVCWYSLPTDTRVNFETFNLLVEQYDAPIRTMRPPSSADVFRRACKEVDLTNNSRGENKRMDFFLHKREYDNFYIHYDISVESWFNDERVSVQDKAGIVTFERKTSKISVHMPIECDEIHTKLQAFMDSEGGLLPVIQIREAIRHAFEKNMKGIRLKNGVYFIPRNYRETLTSLMSVYHDLDGANMAAVPLSDSPMQREMLVFNIRKQLESDLELIQRDIEKLAELDKSDIRIRDLIAIEQSLDRVSEDRTFYANFLSTPASLIVDVGPTRLMLESIQKGS